MRTTEMTCHGTVTNDGIEDVCGKPAAGYAKPSGDETHPWPACAYHLNRWGSIPLADLMARAWDEGFKVGVRSGYRDSLPVRPENPYRPTEGDPS